MLEHIDAALQGRSYSQITVNMRGDSAEAIAARIVENPLTRGLQGPTIAPIYSTEGGWHTVTIIVSNKNLLQPSNICASSGGHRLQSFQYAMFFWKVRLHSKSCTTELRRR